MTGFGYVNARTITANRPSAHIHGDIAAIARPPTSGTTGSRLNRFRKNPVNASARQKSLPVASAIGMHAAAPIDPRIGPARPTRASASALPPSDFDHTAAPRNGMKTGALAAMPSRRSWITWPISCTNSSSTKPIPNFQPHSRLYAATDTSMDPDVVRIFSFGSSSRTTLIFAANFTIRRASAATPPPARLYHGFGSPPNGAGPGSGWGEGSGSGGARKSSELGPYGSGLGGSQRLGFRWSVIRVA